MKSIQADQVLKAIVDGIESYAEIAKRADIDPVMLTEHAEVIDRAIRLMRGFYKYAHENMQPAGLPPPPNLYLDREKGIEEQAPEYYAFEAIQRNNMTQEKCIWTCGQLGLDEAEAATALDNIAMPWRPSNGWKTYARFNTEGTYVLMDKPPVKLKRHIERFLAELTTAE